MGAEGSRVQVTFKIRPLRIMAPSHYKKKGTMSEYSKACAAWRGRLHRFKKAKEHFISRRRAAFAPDPELEYNLKLKVNGGILNANVQS